MLDTLISCSGIDCPIRGKCLRYTERTRESEYLPYAPFEENEQIDDCDFFYNKNANDLDIGIDRLINGTN